MRIEKNENPIFGLFEGKAIAFPFLVSKIEKKMKIRFLGYFEDKAISFHFFVLKIEKIENLFFGFFFFEV